MVFVVLVGIGFIIAGMGASFIISQRKDVFGRAMTLAAMGNYIDARSLVREKLDLEPNYSEAHFVMSKIYAMEGDVKNEIFHLEKIKKIGKYENEIDPVVTSNRIADAYYSQEKFEEAFFHYLDTITFDPENPIALIRLGFMAIGQKEFKITESFLSKVKEENIKFSSFFLVKGICEASLERSSGLPYFEKAFTMDPSMVNGMLYSLSLMKSSKYDEAINMANELLNKSDELYIQLFIYNFIMANYIRLNDYSNAVKYARLSMDLSKESGWKNEYIESCIHFSLLCINLQRFEECTECLIEAEVEKMDDPDIIALANFKFNLERGLGTIESMRGEYDIEKELQFLAISLFPTSRFYELSGLRSKNLINIRGMVNESGKKIINSDGTYAASPIEKFVSSTGTNLKNICVKIAMFYQYRVSREIILQEPDSMTLLAYRKDDVEVKAIFKFRKVRDGKLSDVTLREFQSYCMENGAQEGFYMGYLELTEGAKKYINQMPSKYRVIVGSEFESILTKIIE
jgi:tetratricopeptide (TPR) repeat protein